jgi:hypothetical protein
MKTFFIAITALTLAAASTVSAQSTEGGLGGGLGLGGGAGVGLGVAGGAMLIGVVAIESGSDSSTPATVTATTTN